MSSIETINNELPSTARPKINQNFEALNEDKVEKSDNLADLSSAAEARANLGLGNAATKDVGTGATQVAAGNHAHAGVYEPANANIQSHVADTGNPHSTTKAQVGLGNVDNYATASQAEAEAGTANNKFMTPERVAQAIDALGDGGPITSYTVTKTDVVSTSAETTTISFTVPANTWADGDVIEITGLAKVRNDDGGAGNEFLVKLKAGSGFITIVNAGVSITSEKLWMFKLYLMRVGAACYGGSTNGNYPLETIINSASPSAENTGLLSVNPTFTSDVTVTVTIDLGASSANCYFKPQTVRAIKIAEQ